MNRELCGALAIVLSALTGCAFGPAGGYDEPQGEPPSLDVGTSPARPESAHARVTRPDPRPAALHARAVPQNEPEPVVQEEQ